MTCNIVEWDGSGGLGPEAMFFKPSSGGDFEIWAVRGGIKRKVAAMFVFQWDYHEWGDWPVPYAECEGDIWSVDLTFIS